MLSTSSNDEAFVALVNKKLRSVPAGTIAKFDPQWVLQELRTRGIARVLEIARHPIGSDGCPPPVIPWGSLHSLLHAVFTAAQRQRFISSEEDILAQYIIQIKRDILRHCEQGAEALRYLRGEDFLRVFARNWTTYKIIAEWFQRLFFYLPRCWEESDYPWRKNTSVHFNTVVLLLFSRSVTEPLVDKFIDALSIVQQEAFKRGTMIDINLVRKCMEAVFTTCVINGGKLTEPLDLLRKAKALSINMGTPIETRVYRTCFETKYIRACVGIYERRSAALRLVPGLGFIGFLEAALVEIEKEAEIVGNFIPEASRRAHRTVLEATYFGIGLQNVVVREPGSLKDVLNKRDTVQLKTVARAYFQDSENELLQRGRETVTEAFKVCVDERGEEAYKTWRAKVGEERGGACLALFEELYELLTWCKTVVMDVCFDVSCLRQAYKGSLEGLLRKSVEETENGSLPEALVEAVDKLLRGGGEPESVIPKISALCEVVRDKDVFVEAYRVALAGRLLGDKSKSLDVEKEIISSLKIIYGLNCVWKLEGMINDWMVTTEQSEEFCGVYDSRGGSKPVESLAVNVLTSSSWPSFQTFNASLPNAFKEAFEIFKEFYDRRYPKRKLTVIESEGTALVSGNFAAGGGGGGAKQFKVTTLQAAVLLLFNEHEVLSVARIAELLSVPLVIATRLVHPLCFSKVPPLVAESSNKKITGDTAIRVNTGLTSPQRVITVPSVSLVVTASASAAVGAVVNADRKFALEACVVRIMKTRKVLSEAALVEQTINNVKHTFTPDMGQLRKVLKDLVDREFLECEEEGGGMAYRYI